MPRLAPLLLALTAFAAGCLRPAQSAIEVTDASAPTDAGDAGPSKGLDGSCPSCLPSCAATCAADGGCRWSSAQLSSSQSCPPSGLSLTLAGDSPSFATCSCGDAWFGSTADGGALQRVATGCVQTVVRRSGATILMLVDDPSGKLRLFESTDGTTWTSELPPELLAPGALALDNSGNLHLAGLGQGAVLHLERVDGKWTVETAAAAPGLDDATPILIALGPEGAPRVAFADQGVKLATKSDAGWETSVVADRGTPLSLQVDATGQPHLLYLRDGLRYAVRTRVAGWVTESVDPTATAGALVLTGSGCPRAIWSALGLHYGERTPGGWTTDRFSDGDLAVGDQPLVLLSNGRPLVLHASDGLVLSGR
jgi:hypothetical protein